jgi:hypothetical protein
MYVASMVGMLGQTFSIKVSLPNMLIKCTLFSISQQEECARNMAGAAYYYYF